MEVNGAAFKNDARTTREEPVPPNHLSSTRCLPSLMQKLQGAPAIDFPPKDKWLCDCLRQARDPEWPGENRTAFCDALVDAER